jgi:hypothetical protein
MIRLLLSLFLLTGSAWGTSITIGELQYLSTDHGVSGYKLILNTTGVTALPLTFVNAILTVGGRQESTGPITSATPPVLFEGGPGLKLPSCPCTSLRLQLVFPGNMPVTFMLANGQLFTTNHVSVTFLLPLTGHRNLQPGASIPIMLTAVPEPETWALMSTGLIVLWFCSRRGMRTREVIFRTPEFGPQPKYRASSSFDRP